MSLGSVEKYPFVPASAQRTRALASTLDGRSRLKSTHRGETALMVAQRAIRVIEEIRECFHDDDVLIISHKAID